MFNKTARHYVPEDITLYNYRCENQKSYTDEASLAFLAFQYPWNKVNVTSVKLADRKVSAALNWR
jgi:hypothetical protein